MLHLAKMGEKRIFIASQNVSKEILLTGPKIQAKIPGHSGDCVSRERASCTPSL